MVILGHVCNLNLTDMTETGWVILKPISSSSHAGWDFLWGQDEGMWLSLHSECECTAHVLIPGLAQKNCACGYLCALFLHPWAWGGQDGYFGSHILMIEESIFARILEKRWEKNCLSVRNIPFLLYRIKQFWVIINFRVWLFLIAVGVILSSTSNN